MRLTVVPDGLLERAALTFGLVPTPLVQVTWGMGSARCILAGVELGIFDALRGGDRTAQDLAEILNCHPAGMEALLDALNGFDLLVHREGRYANSRTATKWLLRDTEHSMVDALRFMVDLWDLFSNLEDSVRSGAIADFHHGDHPPEMWERYLRGLAALAPMMAKEVARRVKFPTPPARVLDVAGGHGLFSVALCRRHTELRSEILDLQQAVHVGEQIVAEQGMSDRITYRPGDLRRDEWGTDHDAVLLFNILHNLSEDECRDAIAAASRSLRPGGLLVILDSDHTRRKGNVDQTGGFSEMLCFLTSGTRAYPVDSIRDWMGEAGFGNIRTQRLFTGPYMVLLTAVAGHT